MPKFSLDLLREFIHYDSESGLFTWIKKPARKIIVGTEAGRELRGYRKIRLANEEYFSHRLAWLYVHGTWPEHVIDHINGNGKDNRIANLRDVPQQMNAQNMRAPMASGTTGLQGVSWDKSRKLFKASLTIGPVQKTVGRFPVAEDAHQAYLQAKREFHPGCTL